MKNITFNREQLYKEVWETPVSKLSELYGISFAQPPAPTDGPEFVTNEKTDKQKNRLTD